MGNLNLPISGPLTPRLPEMISLPQGAAEIAPQPSAIATDKTPGAHTSAALAAALAAALSAMMAAHPAPVDLDTVRAIVSAELAAWTTPKPLHIHVNDAPKGIMPSTRHTMADTLLTITAQGIPAYIAGPAGSGKTTAAEQVAHALGATFYVQGAASGAHEFLGFVDAHGAYQTTPFRHAFENGGVFLADEIDGSDAGALLVINSALANGHMAFPDSPRPVVRHDDFRMIAAANTFGTGADRLYVGRSQLDAATLDRFAFISWNYDEALERQLSGNEAWAHRVQNIRASVARLNMRHVVSPRATINGAKLIAAGMDQAAVESSLIWRGLPPADVAKIEAGV
jgi:cobaltochelatase CobS